MNRFSCDVCTYSGSSLSLLRMHKARIHPWIQILNKTRLKVKKPKEKLVRTKERLYCDLCSFSTICNEMMQKHIDTHIKETQTKRFPCDICQYSSDVRNLLNMHKKRIHGIKNKFEPERVSLGPEHQLEQVGTEHVEHPRDTVKPGSDKNKVLESVNGTEEPIFVECEHDHVKYEPVVVDNPALVKLEPEPVVKEESPDEDPLFGY